ncbi:MAG: PASTA domain-containing protein [Bacteroidia bacterium]|nr:PASTA domain-containing protein [Bacteroidia bacterium]
MKSPVVRFLFSRIFWKNVLIALLVTIGLIILVQISLYFYTGHGKKIRVPDFTGMSLQQVDRLCSQNNIKWIIQDSTYLAESPRGSVLNQYIEYIPHFAPTYVLEQKFGGKIITEGTNIEKGSGITLVVGEGLSNERAPVPNLLNISRETARILALNNYFNLGASKYDSTVTNALDSSMAKVYKQFPDVSYQARLGFSIDIWLTRDSLRIMLMDSAFAVNDTLINDTTQIQK